MKPEKQQPQYQENRLTKSFEVPFRQLEESIINLTPAQICILRLVAEGNSNKEIAKILNITSGTTRGHVSEILRQTSAYNRTHAAVAYHLVFIEKLPQI